MEGIMNKKMILSWLSLVMLVATSVPVPVAAGSSENVIRFAPEVRRVGVVVAYIPGQSITIADRQGNQFAFELASPLKIVPAHRANLLGPGAFVTIIAPNNVPNGKHIAVGIVIHRGVPPGLAGPSAGPTPNAPVVFPPPNTPLVPEVDKPPEEFSPFDMSSLPPLQIIVGYNLPGDFVDWAMPIRVAAFETITIDSAETFTPVGVVEIGSDQNSPRIYQAEIDLNSTATEVAGRLVPLTATVPLDVTFQRIPQIVTPERTDSPYEEFQSLEPAPASASSIFAGGVCFVATTADGPIKYCSTASASDDSTQLSVTDNFPSQYADLQDLISPVAAQFGLLDVIQMDQIISMQEDFQHIQECASALTQQACGADMVVAPVSEQYFEQQYNEKFGEGDEDDEDNGDNGDNGGDQSPAPFAVGVLKILRPVDASGGTVEPGDYRVDYWFDANGVFYAATLTGVRTDNTQVTNQQIPAVPATFVNADGTELPGAHISACRIIGKCIWQRRCG
jgi:hypothetical protein